MNSQFEFIPNLSRGNFSVAKLRNSRAQAYLNWVCVSRFELDHFPQCYFKWQLDPPNSNQRLLRTIVLTLILLSGCQTISLPGKSAASFQTDQSITQSLDQVENDINNLKATGAEWMVRDRLTGFKQVSMSDLLKIARQKNLSGDSEEANRLATKLSELASYAFAQHQNNQDAKPEYSLEYVE